MRKIRTGSVADLHQSTVAKNVFLWQAKLDKNRVLKTYFTFLSSWSGVKNDILEMYLNIAEMGEGIYGIEAAAQAYFKKPAVRLTRSQAAMIAACLRNPKKYTVKPMSKFVSSRYPWILKQMNNLQSRESFQSLLQ